MAPHARSLGSEHAVTKPPRHGIADHPQTIATASAARLPKVNERLEDWPRAAPVRARLHGGTAVRAIGMISGQSGALG